MTTTPSPSSRRGRRRLFPPHIPPIPTTDATGDFQHRTSSHSTPPPTTPPPRRRRDGCPTTRRTSKQHASPPASSARCANSAMTSHIPSRPVLHPCPSRYRGGGGVIFLFRPFFVVGRVLCLFIIHDTSLERVHPPRPPPDVSLLSSLPRRGFTPLPPYLLPIRPSFSLILPLSSLARPRDDAHSARTAAARIASRIFLQVSF